MMRTLRATVRELAAQLLGERAAWAGAVARDRRLIRQALAGHDAGAVLVVGPGLAARQALPTTLVDVTGTSPHSAEVTVCSFVESSGSLPLRRWDTVIVTDLGKDGAKRLNVISAACRDNAKVLIFGEQDLERLLRAPAVAEVARVVGVLGRRRRRLWLAVVP